LSTLGVAQGWLGALGDEFGWLEVVLGELDQIELGFLVNRAKCSWGRSEHALSPKSLRAHQHGQITVLGAEEADGTFSWNLGLAAKTADSLYIAQTL
jgi:hypothetical protein